MPFLALAVAHADTVRIAMPGATTGTLLTPETMALLAGLVGIIGVGGRLLHTVIVARFNLGGQAQAAAAPVAAAACAFTPEAVAALDRVHQMASAVDDEGRPRWMFPAQRIEKQHEALAEALREVSENGRRMVEIMDRMERRACPWGAQPPTAAGGGGR